MQQEIESIKDNLNNQVINISFIQNFKDILILDKVKNALRQEVATIGQ